MVVWHVCTSFGGDCAYTVECIIMLNVDSAEHWHWINPYNITSYVLPGVCISVSKISHTGGVQSWLRHWCQNATSALSTRIQAI